MNLLTDTLDMLERTRLSDQRLSDMMLSRSGVKTTRSWIGKVRRGDISEPGARKLEALHNILASATDNNRRAQR